MFLNINSFPTYSYRPYLFIHFTVLSTVSSTAPPTPDLQGMMYKKSKNNVRHNDYFDKNPTHFVYLVRTGAEIIKYKT